MGTMERRRSWRAVAVWSEFIIWASHVPLLVLKFWRRWWRWVVAVVRRRAIKIWVSFLARAFVVMRTIEVWFITVRAIEVRTLELWGIRWGWKRVLPVIIWRWCIEVGWRWHIVVGDSVWSIFWTISMMEILIRSSWRLAVRETVMEGWWRWISADWQRNLVVRFLPWRRWQGMIALAVLGRTTSMVLASLWMLEMGELRVLEVRKLGVLEVWLSKFVELLVIELTAHLSVQLVSSVMRMVRNSLDDTLQAVAVFEADSLLMAAVVSNRSLLLVDKVLDLS